MLQASDQDAFWTRPCEGILGTLYHDENRGPIQDAGEALPSPSGLGTPQDTGGAGGHA